MAAGAWTFYNLAKSALMDGSVDLDTHAFKLALFTSASNAATATLKFRGSLTNEIAAAGGYAAGGRSITSVTWTTGASASEYRFDSTALIFTASGANLSAIKFAVLYDANGASAGAQNLVCYSQLSTAQFSVTSGNTLTITPSANGYFELN